MSPTRHLHEALQQAKLRVVGHHDIFDEAEMMLMTAVLGAYGQSEHGFVYAEPALLDARIPPPDLVLAHPDLGVVVFECKAYDMSYIRGAEAGNLKIIRYGRETMVNPLKQAQRGMFAIKDAYEQFTNGGMRPLFHAVVALPNIHEAEWKELGYDRCIDSRMILFHDQLQDIQRLQKRLKKLVQSTMQRVGTTTPYPLERESVLLRVFGDSAVINDARLTVRDLEPDRLGKQIDAIEQAHKQLSAEQQLLSRLDTWGHPFLVRGVAGSGKSIVLANQVARILYRLQKQSTQLSLFEDNQFTPPRIGIICFNRSLVPLLRERIQRAYGALTGQDLPEYVIVTDLNRLLFAIAQKTEAFRYIRINGTQRDTRARKHLEGLENLRTTQPRLFERILFDGLMIDEAQDAHPDEYALLRALVRPSPKTNERSITIFYDDAQNLYGNPPPTWRNLNLNVTGGRAAFMQECYRNSREILELGMNVLLGTQAQQRQRIATRRYVDVLTLQEKGLLEEMSGGWCVHFAKRAGVEPVVRGFQSRFEQLDWVAEAVVAMLEADQVRPEHILLLAPRSTSFRYLSQRLHQLATNPLKLRLVGGNYQQHIDDLLIVSDHLTMATVYAAKGYDAPVTFLVDVDQMETTVTGRALFYVGVTRAKRYLIVTGLDLPNTLMREALAVSNQRAETHHR